MRNVIIGGSIVLMALTPARGHAGAERAGTTAANFLSVGAGPRILGMGGATLGLAGGIGSCPWNPGSLGWLNETEIGLSHAGLADEVSQEWVGIGGRLGISRMRWSVSTLYQTEGTFDGRDASNQSTGSFGVSSMAVGGQLARPLGSSAALGIGGKWVNQSIGSIMRGSGVAFDAGLQMRLGQAGFGIAAQNLGGSMKFGSQSYPFSSNVGAGVAYDLRASGLRAALDVNVPNDYYTNLRGGIEWTWKERMALRGGYRKEIGAPDGDNLSGPSFGIGAGAYGLWLDYAFLVTTDGQGQHRMGLAFRPRAVKWGDPFGQRQMPTEFDTQTPIGPQAPAKSKPRTPDH